MASENVIRIRIEECEKRKYFFTEEEPTDTELSKLSTWFKMSNTTPPNNTNNGSE